MISGCEELIRHPICITAIELKQSLVPTSYTEVVISILLRFDQKLHMLKVGVKSGSVTLGSLNTPSCFAEMREDLVKSHKVLLS